MSVSAGAFASSRAPGPSPGTTGEVAGAPVGTWAARAPSQATQQARVQGSERTEARGPRWSTRPHRTSRRSSASAWSSSPTRPGCARRCTRRRSRRPSGAAPTRGSTPAAGRTRGAPRAAAGDKWPRWTPPRAPCVDRWRGGSGVHPESGDHGGGHRVDSTPVRSIRWGSAGHPGIRRAVRCIERTGTVTVRCIRRTGAPADDAPHSRRPHRRIAREWRHSARSTRCDHRG